MVVTTTLTTTVPAPRCVYLMGVGHIAGSLALAIRDCLPHTRLHGYDLNPDHRQAARTLAMLDVVDDEPGASAHHAEVVVLGVPLAQTAAAVLMLQGKLDPQAVITDVGSVKRHTAASVEQALGLLPTSSTREPAIVCVPGHPVAGTEHTGPRAARANLFVNRYVALTPPLWALASSSDGDGVDGLAVQPAYAVAEGKVVALWQGVGARVERMRADHHDALLALTSHMPHLLAFAFVASMERASGQLTPDQHAIASSASNAARDEVQRTLGRYAAGGFRDFTRIAASHPAMWTDIILANKTAVQDALRCLREDLATIDDWIATDDNNALQGLFAEAQTLRQAVMSFGQAGAFLYNDAAITKPASSPASESKPALPPKP